MAALRVGSTVRIADLAARFGVSTETVRRDLDELSRQGSVDRTCGAAPAVSFHEAAVDERARERVAERRRIGACAAGLIDQSKLGAQSIETVCPLDLDRRPGHKRDAGRRVSRCAGCRRHRGPRGRRGGLTPLVTTGATARFGKVSLGLTKVNGPAARGAIC